MTYRPNRRQLLQSTLVSAAAFTVLSFVAAQAFPSRTIKLIYRWTAGSGGDVIILAVAASAVKTLISGHLAMEEFAHREGNFRVECLPTCKGPENPPRYKPISYPDYKSWHRNRNDDAPPTAA